MTDRSQTMKSGGNDATCQTGKPYGPAVFTGNAVDLLVDGPAASDALFDAIDSATHHVHLEFYIYKSVHEGQAGWKLAQALQAKLREGVEICLLYDPAGSRSTPRSFFERLKAQGIRVLEYNPANPFRTRTGWHPNQRDHRKLLIVDGRIAILGGIDISKHYAKHSYREVDAHELDPRAGGWRDTDVRIEGPAVAALQRLFLQTWRMQKGGALAGDYFPAPEKRGDHRVRVLSARPAELPNAIHDAYLDAIRQARSRVHITNAYFMPDEQIAAALRQAAESGVDVKLVLPGFSDFAIVVHGQHYHYAKLLQAGVKIFERQNQLLHAKTAVIDGCWSTVGSYNLDLRSMLHAAEVNAVILGKEFAGKMEAMFQEDLAQSKRVTLQQWQQRPVTQCALEWLANRFSYWL
jgi:cardiolipin synthase